MTGSTPRNPLLIAHQKTTQRDEPLTTTQQTAGFGDFWYTQPTYTAIEEQAKQGNVEKLRSWRDKYPELRRKIDQELEILEAQQKRELEIIKKKQAKKQDVDRAINTAKSKILNLSPDQQVKFGIALAPLVQLSRSKMYADHKVELQKIIESLKHKWSAQQNPQSNSTTTTTTMTTSKKGNNKRRHPDSPQQKQRAEKRRKQ